MDIDCKVNETHTVFIFNLSLTLNQYLYRWDAMGYILRSCLLQRNAVKWIGNKKINPHMIRGFFSSFSVTIIILKERTKWNFNFPDIPWWWINSTICHRRKPGQREIQIDLFILFLRKWSDSSLALVILLYENLMTSSQI